MTTEQKARAYDDALTTAKRIISENCSEVEKLCLKCIFPQLKESEDERIRKWLVDYFKEVGKSWIHRDISPEQILSYLEKQKEQKPEWSEEDERMIDTIVSVLSQYIDYKAVSGTGSGYATPRYNKEIDWLKSLRPSWKPSEEDNLPRFYGD